LDLRDEGMASLRDNGCDEAWDLLKYLNTQESSNRYTSILKNYPVALEAVRKLPEPIKTQQAQILHDIKDQAQPFYAAKDNTLRVFSIGNSILTLKSEIRHVLCGDWTEVDLQSAHLALAAAEWGIPEISNFLRTGVSIWASLAQYLNMELTPVLKGFLKDYLYATVYGMGRKKLCEMIRKSEFEGTIHYSKIMAHPIIILLWEARNKRMAEICAAGGAKDIFGRWIPFDDDNVVGYDAPKCLAQANQAAELWLLYPVIGLVAGKDSTPHGALITLWQHDGFSFSPNREADRGMWIRRFQQAVQERADSIGAVTHLVVKEG
jgi:hypothetical protein